MSYTEILLIAIALSMDAFAVSIGAGCQFKKPTFNQYFRMSFAFGFFQFGMVMLGFIIGENIVNFIYQYAQYIASALLLGIGIKMIKDSFSNKEEQSTSQDPSKGLVLLGLAIATSIDALLIGLSFSLLHTAYAVTEISLIIGIVCAFISALGVYLGSVISRADFIAHKAELLGGLILSLLAFYTFFSS